MQPGTQVGAYRMLRMIGAGGMGAVWLAEHTMLGRQAAIKVLHAEYSTRDDVVTRFFNEARAATAISDPGIVQVFDFGHHVDGSAYIVMEMLEGETLAQRLAARGPLPIADALRLVRQVAGSLGAAHARGIVHRDLKPDNIFVVADAEVIGGERAKILDFGIAKLVGDPSLRTQTAAVMGTPTFMSPEQCRGAGEVDQRSDIYSLGCVLFNLLTGFPPFHAEGIGEIIAMHLREPPPSPSSRSPIIPPTVDALVLRCLAKDPALRPASGRELVVAITDTMALVAAAPAVVGPPPPRSVVAAAAMTAPETTLSAANGTPSIVAPVPRRARGALAVIGLVVAVAATVTAIVATRHDDSQLPTPRAELTSQPARAIDAAVVAIVPPIADAAPAVAPDAAVTVVAVPPPTPAPAATAKPKPRPKAPSPPAQPAATRVVPPPVAPPAPASVPPQREAAAKAQQAEHKANLLVEEGIAAASAGDCDKVTMIVHEVLDLDRRAFAQRLKPNPAVLRCLKQALIR